MVNQLKRAISEIKNLRNDNTIMRARLDVFDSMMAVFNNRPMKGWGSVEQSSDIVKELELLIVEQTVSKTTETFNKDLDKIQTEKVIQDEAGKF